MSIRAQCPADGGHDPDEVIVYIVDELDPDGIGILVSGDGRVTRRWADGTAGLSDEQAREAEQEDDAYCSTHRDEYGSFVQVEWRHL